MPESDAKQLKGLHLRAALPRIIRFGAAGLLVVILLVVVIGFLRARNNPEFRMKGFPTSLSKDIVATVAGYERREMDGELVKYFIKADKATTFADNHQELENVFLEVFDETGQNSDRITALKAVYIPEENKNFTGYFAGDVNIQTRDSLNVRTEQVTYKKSEETATADEHIAFERANVRGTAFGAVVKVKEKRIELLRDVDIQTFESAEQAKSNISSAHIKAGSAAYDQINEQIDLQTDVTVNAVSRGAGGAQRFADIESQRARVFLAQTANGGRDFQKVELFDTVSINTSEHGRPRTKITSGYAIYDKSIDRFDLKNAVHIVMDEANDPTNIDSQSAVYEQTNGKIFLNGGAQITRGGNLVKGDAITAELYATKKLRSANVRGNAYLKQATAEKTSEVSGGEMNAAFDENQILLRANALNTAVAVLTPVNANDYTKVTLSSPNSVRLVFKGEGLLETMQTDGRTTIQLDVPDNAPDSANKRVTADTVKTVFNANGKDIQAAEAVGNAELYVEPHRAADQNYRTTVNAPRFDCEFFPTGNNAKLCVASTKTKTVRVPTVPLADRGTQTITADKLTAVFSAQTNDVERLDADGNAKFSELDRNALSSQFSFTTGDGIVKLRGGEPTAWDSRARAKAGEIDWDTRNQKSYLRGGASTTYYSQKQTGGAAPFEESDKPVYITADVGEFDHRAETAHYSGRARGWQENNYVRGDRFTVFQKQGEFHAEGNVQSLLYNARRSENGKETNVPVYASAGKMAYDRNGRVLRYENAVDIRQGTDRIMGGIATVLLTEKNEVTRTDVENNVVITQPNRRAVADFARYDVREESVSLRGNPARVEDAENGSSQGGELTVFLKQNRVVGEGKSKQNSAGRIRSVYKVKNN